MQAACASGALGIFPFVATFLDKAKSMRWRDGTGIGFRRFAGIRRMPVAVPDIVFTANAGLRRPDRAGCR